MRLQEYWLIRCRLVLLRIINMRFKLEDGKYEYEFTEDGRQLIKRHGEAWRDETGDGFIYAMACEIENLYEILDKLDDVLPCDVEEIING